MACDEGVGVVVQTAEVIVRLNALELDRVGCGFLQGCAWLQGKGPGRVVVTEVVKGDMGCELKRASIDQGVVIERTVEADLNFCGSTS